MLVFLKRIGFFSVLKVAKKFEKVTFAIAAKDDFSGQLSDLGIDTSSEDLNVVIWDDKGQKFRMDTSKAFSVDVLEGFVKEYLDGKVEPYLKSEDVPSDNSGPVKVSF